MMKFNRVAAVALLLATSAGCWAADAAAPSTWEKVKAFTHEQKKDAVAEGKKLIAATDKKLADLSKQAKSSTGEVKAGHEKNMKELQAKKKEAEVQLAKLEKASSKAWDATKEGFSNAYKELHQATSK